MKTRNTGLFQGTAVFAALAVSLLTPARLAAQAAPSSSGASGEIVQLSPFEVNATPVGPYQPTEALAGGRIAVNLFESTDNISIVTQELMQDIGTQDIYNSTKYLAGIANNSSQVAGDRVSIRGFQVSNPDIDGFDTTQSVVKTDPYFYENVEFVRGPDSLLAPNGSPGGTLNLVSKTAKFADFGSATAQGGEYDTESASFDVNRLVNRDVAYRLVTSWIGGTQGDNQGYRESVGFSPSMVFKLGSESQLLLHFFFFSGSEYNYLGLPINPATRNGGEDISFLPGLNKYETPYADVLGDGSSANHSNRAIYRALFTSNLNDSLSMRLAARYLWDWQTNNQWNLTGNAGGGVDPYTGVFTPGLAWSGSSAAGFTSSPAAPTGPNYTVSQSPTNLLERYVDVQNDWVYHLRIADAVDTQTTAGAAAEIFHVLNKGYSAVSPPVDVYALPSHATWTPGNSAVSDQDIVGNFEQVYLNEKLKFWNDRIILNGSVVPTWFYEDVTNYLSGVSSTSHPHPTFVNYGVDVLPVPYASIYFGHSADAAQISPPSFPTATNPNPPQIQSGKQDEAGLRLKFLGGHVTASVAYFQLYQTNNSIVNPALFSVPPPTVFPPNIYSDRVARGWEYEVNATINKNLSVIASAANSRNRSPYNVRFRADPESTGALYVNYRFDTGTLNGLSLSAGIVAQGKAAGDAVSGVTAASTTTRQIPNLPSFYMPGYALVNLAASYRVDRHWLVRLFLDNALDKSYFAGSLNANAVMPGMPINPRASVTYSF